MFPLSLLENEVVLYFLMLLSRLGISQGHVPTCLPTAFFTRLHI